jgi:hypothetical protein
MTSLPSSRRTELPSLNAQPLVAEEAVISLEMRRTIAIEQLVGLMERLKEADTDGMAMTTLQSALEIVIAISDCDCNYGDGHAQR